MSNKVLVIGGAIVVLVVVAGLILTQSGGLKNPTNVTVSPAPTEAVATPSSTASPSAMKEETRVLVTETGFVPPTVTVKVGTKVIWENKTSGTVNVSSAVHPTHLVYPKLNLGNFGPGESVSLTFADLGTYKYHDHLSPSHTGTVVVE